VRILSWGQIPLSQSIQVQNLAMSSFSNVDLCEKMGLDMEAKTKVAIEIAYIPMQEYWSFWRMNERICKPQVK
jgi:hypothetical protein